jgi:transcriptional regulator with XRE-family HTH domain
MSAVPASVNFRQNLRRVMIARRISQRALAKKSKTSYPYVNRVLQGRTEPTVRNGEKLAEAIGVSLPDLLADPDVFEKKFGALLTPVST